MITPPIKSSPGENTRLGEVLIICLYKIEIANSEYDLVLHDNALVSEILASVLISQTLNALRKVVHLPFVDLKIGYPYVSEVAEYESERKF